MKTTRLAKAVALSAALASSVGWAQSTTNLTASGELIVSFRDVGSHTWVAPTDISGATVLIVGGGGGGGGGTAAGGGGGGQVVLASNQTFTAGTAYALTVGAGGAGGAGSNPGTAGAASSFDAFTADGGGTGDCQDKENDNYRVGANGGGDGAQNDSKVAEGTGVTKVEDSVYWYGGHAGGSSTRGYWGGGGGGGALTDGGSATELNIGCTGGDGLALDITGEAVVYACGGGGGVNVKSGTEIESYKPGKSVLIGAIDLLCGGRADHALVRQGAQQSAVMAEIVLPSEAEAAIAPLLEDAGIDACEDGRLILRRTISAAGAGRCLVNNCPATVQTLHRIGEHLVDLHGPHDNQSLFNPIFQLDALDAFGRCRPLRDAVARELDMLHDQIKEIAEAELSPDTDGDALVAEHAESANAATLLELGGAVLQGLSEGEASVVDLLAAAIRGFEDMQRHGSTEASAWAAEAKSASIQVGELAKAVASNLSRIDASPERLQWLEARMTLVQKLKRKYGGSVEKVLAFLEKAQARAGEIAGRAGRIAELDAQIAAAGRRLDDAAAKLTAVRAKASGKLGAAVSAQLADLGLPHAAFRVDVAPAAADRESGRDMVEFGFAPNPGEPMRPLRSIASSGEISRVMLALKTVLAEHDTIPVLVFDEIDANIGGEIANIVGAKLAAVGKLHQVICITHLPQVAAWGRSHFAVTKHVEKGRTATRINPVEGDDRVDELARMLGGADLTSVTLAHARELLQKSR